MPSKKVVVRITDAETAKGKKLQALDSLATEIRAPFLDRAITVEGLLTWIIGYHFCPEEERRSLFYSLVINRPAFTLKTKIDVFDGILKLKYPELLDSYPKLTARLHKVREFRNLIAHAEIDRSDKFLSKNVDDAIRLIYHQAGTRKTKLVTTRDIGKKLAECSSVILALVALYDDIVERVSASRE